MSNPKIKIPLTGMDMAMEALGIAALILLFAYPGYYYDQLPEIIPTHFNGAGEPDGFSSKGSVWTLPLIGGVMYVSMLILGRFPHIFNYPKTITEENAERQYRLASKMMRSLNLIIILMFCYLTYQTFEIALDNSEGLGSSFVVLFLVGTFTPVVVYMIQAFRKPNSTSTAAIDSE